MACLTALVRGNDSDPGSIFPAYHPVPNTYTLATILARSSLLRGSRIGTSS